jgi:hypothetical protein
MTERLAASVFNRPRLTPACDWNYFSIGQFSASGWISMIDVHAEFFRDSGKPKTVVLKSEVP